jgi:hypothetical protein
MRHGLECPRAAHSRRRAELSRRPDHADRALGRRRRHRCHRAHHRQPDGEGTGPAGHRGQPHRRQRRGRPRGHRSAPPDGYTIGLATVEIGMMHWQGLTELSGASYTPIGLVNADPAGIQVRADAPYKTCRTCWPRSRPTPASSRRPAPARAASGTWRWPACCATRRSTRPAVPWVPEQRRRARPAGHGGRRHRDRAGVAARSALADRRRQGQEPGDHERQAGRRCTRTCRRSSPRSAATGPWPPGAASSRPRASRPTCATSSAASCRRWPTARTTPTSWPAAASAWSMPAGGLRQVHGQVGRGARRDDEGRGHREVSCFVIPAEAAGLPPGFSSPGSPPPRGS